MLGDVEAFKVGQGIVERIAIAVMKLTTFRNRAVMVLPYCTVKVGRPALSPVMAAVIVAR
jgi:hypothetical protein